MLLFFCPKHAHTCTWYIYLFGLGDKVVQQLLVVTGSSALDVCRDEEVVDGPVSVVQIEHTELQVLDGRRHLVGSVGVYG